MKTAKELNAEIKKMKKPTQVQVIMKQNEILARIADQLERIQIKMR
jgi:hypothetical protein